jgi:phenylacetic acid degradation protein paaN
LSTDLFEKHKALLERAVAATDERGYWSPFSESPSPRAYGDTAAEDGRVAFEAHRGSDFDLGQDGAASWVGGEVSPFGFELGVRYPHVPADALVERAGRALESWRGAGPRVWVGVALETLARLNRSSFEIAQAVQHTTGQGFMMAFQAGGPHAQDRGLEAVAYAWREMSRLPGTALWEKPQGKHEPLRMEKTFTIVPRGVALVIACSTFPTWNSYPGLFASLATGNTVIVKPHPAAILPLAITVRIAREVLREAGLDPDIVSLAAHEAGDDTVQALALAPAVRLIDFTGSSANGTWLERNARQALVFTEKAGVNPVVIDSADDFASVARNLAFSFALYSGQMCTAPQNVYIPRDGIDTGAGHLGFEQAAGALAEAVGKLTADAARAVEITGAIQNPATLARLDEARATGLPVLCDSRALAHPQYPGAVVRTPLLLQAQADSPEIAKEWFGPIAFVIATDSTEASVDLARRSVQAHGALSFSGYTTRPDVSAALCAAAERAGVSLSLNLTGAVFVNQTAAFSDFHGTGANPAANAALSDSAYVSSRFRVVQTRRHA